MPDDQASAPSTALQFDIDRLTTGDIEDMEAYFGKPVLPLLLKAFQAMGGTNDPAVMLEHLPARVLSALLGVSRRQQDPTFGPERWREIPFSDLGGSDDEEAPDPTQAALPLDTTASV